MENFLDLTIHVLLQQSLLLIGNVILLKTNVAMFLKSANGFATHLVSFFMIVSFSKLRLVLFLLKSFTAQKMKFSVKDFFSKCDQICSFQRIWSHLLKKPLMGNFIFCAVIIGKLQL